MDIATTGAQVAERCLNSSVTIGSLFSGAMGALASIGMGEGAGVTAGVVAACSLLGALFAKIPDIIKARTESKKVEVNFHDDAQKLLIEQIYRNQDRERAATEKQLTRLEAENAILRNTKHEMLNELQACTYFLLELREICKQHGIEYPKHSLPSFVEIIRAEDVAIKRITLPTTQTPNEV